MSARAFRTCCGFLLSSALGMSGCLDPSQGEGDDVAVEMAALESATGDAVLRPAADTYVAELLPGTNFGTRDSLLVAGIPLNGFKHALVRFDNHALAFAVGGRPIVSARLSFAVDGVVTSGNVAIHRMKQGWTETGANWLCANQSGLLCPWGSGWNMFTSLLGAPYVTTAADTERASFSSTELIFDVTSDVRAFVAGTTPNHGWLLKKASSSLGVALGLRSKESSRPPRLLIELGNPPDPAQAQACRDALVRDEALSDEEANRKYQRQWVLCGGPDISICMASLLADHNIDYTQAATELFHGNISPAEYLAVSRDRTRKRFLAMDDPTWACSYVAGDADSDRVPDDRDMCPGTPELTQTDDVGCTVTTLPPAPPEDDVHEVLDHMGVVVARPGACDGLEPETPDVLSLNRSAISAIDPSGNVAFSFTEAKLVVTPVPAPTAECVVWYQFQAKVADSVFDDQQERFYQLALQAAQADATAPGMVLFDLKPDMASSLGKFASLEPVSQYPVGGPLTQIRVRAVYANGAKSSWSSFKTFD